MTGTPEARVDSGDDVPAPGAGTSRGAAARRVLTASAIVAAFAAVLFLTWESRRVILLLFGGFLFGLFLSAIADWVHERMHVRRGIALGGVVALLVGLVALGAWAAGPAIAQQASALQDELPRAIDNLKSRIDGYALGRQALDNLPDSPESLLDEQQLVARATSVFSSVLGIAGNLFIIFLFGLFIASQPGTLLDGIVQLVAPGRRRRVRAVLVEAGAAARLWLLAKVVRIVFIALATYGALKLLGVPLALLLALIAAPLNFVPNFGPIIASVPAILLALLQGPQTALWVAALYVGIQFIEGNVLDPILTKTIVAIPPALTFATQIILAVIAGPVGLAVATPLVAVLVVLVRRLYIEDALERSGSLVTGTAGA